MLSNEVQSEMQVYLLSAACILVQLSAEKCILNPNWVNLSAFECKILKLSTV